jgi:hypothetical protein
MTLKEKFEERLYNQSHDDSECLRIRFENIDKVIDSQEIIADDFAIGFVWWVSNGDHKYTVEWNNGHHTTKELLEIYKKIRGL